MSNKSKRTKAFLKIQINPGFEGKIIFELFNDITPKTAYNFEQLCKRDQGKGYKNTKFHRILKNFIAQGGDYTKEDGSGSLSVYGRYFEDESFNVKHSQPYLLSMANQGPNTNGSQFFITFQSCPWLDGKNVVFGKVIQGFSVVDKIHEQGSQQGNPKKIVRIIDCGVL